MGKRKILFFFILFFLLLLVLSNRTSAGGEIILGDSREQIERLECAEPTAEELQFSYSSKYVMAQSNKIGAECDKIIEHLIARYGEPKKWTQFPVIFTSAPGGNIAGYTSYIAPVVSKVVVYQSYEQAVGGTLDHELTHAFFFYYFNSNFDLFLNEGLAQNSEYKRRNVLRQTVYVRYTNGDFWPLNQLYNRNQYDSALRIYHEGFSVVDFLIARGGSRWFAWFVDDLTNSTRNINKSLLEWYGYKTLSELENAWIKYIEEGQNTKSAIPVK